MDRRQRQERNSSIQSVDSGHSVDPSAFEDRIADSLKTEEDVPLSEPMSWYPPVAPPTGGKVDIFDIDRFRSIDARAKEAPRELNKSYRELLTYLTSNLTSDLEKVRAIFTWIGVKDIVNSLGQYNSYPAKDSPEWWMRKAAEGDNACFVALFTVLCRKAGVPCMTVKGLVKAAAYDPGHRDTCGTSVWAIVHVACGWRFVHPLWAFKCVHNYNRGVWMLVEDTGKATHHRSQKEEGEAKGHVDEFWFLTDPADFNFLCQPEDPGKQLLAQPWTEEVFLGLPGLKADFFKSPWKLLGPHKAVVDTKNGKCTIDFQHPVDGKAEVRYKLYFDEDKSQEKFPTTLQVDRCVTLLKAGNGVVSLVTRLPVVGLYKLEVSGVYNNVFSGLGNFCLQCSHISEPPKPFPSNPENGFGYDETSQTAGIENPSQVEGVMLVNRGQMIDFSFQVDEDRELKPQLKHGLKHVDELSCHVSIQRHEKQVTIGVELPPDDPHPEYSLEIYVGGRRRSVVASNTGKTIKNEGSASTEGSEIRNKRSNSSLDPVTTLETGNTSEGSEISNSYKGGNTRLDPVGPAPGARGGRDMREDLINAVNYLLTSDKELHEETSNEARELHRELQEALASDKEARIREAVRRFLEAGERDPVAEARVQARETFWWQTREKLHSAAGERSLGRLNRVVHEFTSHNMEDTGELEPALDRLLSLSERAIKSAVASQSLTQLGTALKRVRCSEVGPRARSRGWFRQAQCLHTNQTVQALCARCSDQVQTAAVLSLGDRPLNRPLLAVLRATLCLLGEDDDNVKSGQSVKSRLRETSAGKSRLLERIKHFQVERINKDHVCRAEKQLSCCGNADSLEQNGGSAARLLHDWCQAMVRELSHHIWEEEDEEEDEEEEEEDED